MFEKSIDLLNKSFEDELYAVQQYICFHLLCRINGQSGLSELFLATAITKVDHSEILAERIHFLKGNIKIPGGCQWKEIGSVKEMLEQSVEMEEKAIKCYTKFAHVVGEYSDPVSRRVFEMLSSAGEDHLMLFNSEIQKNKEPVEDAERMLQ